MKDFPNDTDAPPKKIEPSPADMERIKALIVREDDLIENKVSETTDRRFFVLIGQFPAAFVCGLSIVAIFIDWFNAQEKGRGLGVGWVFAATLAASIVCGIVSRLSDRTEEMREETGRELLANNGIDPRIRLAKTIVAAYSVWVKMTDQYRRVYTAVNGDLGSEGDKIADACSKLISDGNEIIARAIAIFLLKEDSGLFNTRDGAVDEIGFGNHEKELAEFIEKAGAVDYGRQLIAAAVEAEV